ncbi:hypothetical protein SVIOM74S_07948 [Streptomyces violarus]
MFGADPYDKGAVKVAGSAVPKYDVNAAMTAGIGLTPTARARVWCWTRRSRRTSVW